MSPARLFDMEGYEGSELYHFENWLIEIKLSPKLEIFHDEVDDLLDFFESHNPNPYEFHSSIRWGEFVDRCEELADKLQNYSRGKRDLILPADFPKIAEHCPMWAQEA